MVPLTAMMLFSLTGCLTFETIVKVLRNGSGTVEQTFIFTNEMVRMALMFGGDDGGPADLCSEGDLLSEANAMGEGVTLVSFEPVNTDNAIGCRAQFAFEDINTLRVSFDPEDQMPDALTEDMPEPEGLEDEEDEPEGDFVTFGFDPGNPATLTVNMNQDLGSNEQQNEAVMPDTAQTEQQMQMIREMFKGGRMAIVLDVEGTITETNASFHEGNRVTLFEIDFDKLLEDEAYLRRMANANPQNAEEMQALMQDVEGVRMETNETVTVRFKK